MTALAKLESMEELLDIFWQVVTENVPETVSVRKSWKHSPDWGFDQDVIFLKVEEMAGEDITQPFDDIWEDKGEDLLLTQGTTRVIRLSAVAYGPGVYNHICRLRTALLRGVYALRRLKIYSIPETDAVVYAPEEFQSRWWLRTDFSIRFNVLTIYDTDVKVIKQVNVATAANGPGESQRVIAGNPIIVRKD